MTPLIIITSILGIAYLIYRAMMNAYTPGTKLHSIGYKHTPPPPKVLDINQIESTHYQGNTLLIHFYPRPGNPHYHEYYRDGDTWRKCPGMKIVDKETQSLLNNLLIIRLSKKVLKGGGRSKTF